MKKDRVKSAAKLINLLMDHYQADMISVNYELYCAIKYLVFEKTDGFDHGENDQLEEKLAELDIFVFRLPWKRDFQPSYVFSKTGILEDANDNIRSVFLTDESLIMEQMLDIEGNFTCNGVKFKPYVSNGSPDLVDCFASIMKYHQHKAGHRSVLLTVPGKSISDAIAKQSKYSCYDTEGWEKFKQAMDSKSMIVHCDDDMNRWYQRELVIIHRSGIGYHESDMMQYKLTWENLEQDGFIRDGHLVYTDKDSGRELVVE